MGVHLLINREQLTPDEPFETTIKKIIKNNPKIDPVSNLLKEDGPKLTKSMEFFAQQLILNEHSNELKEILIAKENEDLKEIIGDEIIAQCCSYKKKIPDHCKYLTNPRFVSSPEESTSGLFGFSNVNMLQRNIRWESNVGVFSLLERSFPIIGAFPRMLASIHMFSISFIYTVTHGIASMSASWDKRKINNEEMTPYYRASACFHAKLIVHSLENLFLSFALAIPFAGQLFAYNRAGLPIRHAYPTEILPEGWRNSSDSINTRSVESIDSTKTDVDLFFDASSDPGRSEWGGSVESIDSTKTDLEVFFDASSDPVRSE